MEDKDLNTQNQRFDQGQPNQQQYTQPAKAVVYDTMPMKNNNMAIAGLVVGIFSLLVCWIPFWNLLLSIAGIVCSAIGLSRKQKSGMAIGGLVASIIALLISIFIMVLYVIALSIVQHYNRAEKIYVFQIGRAHV